MPDLSGPASCLLTAGGCFCENHPLDGLVQPANIMTALAFVVIALLALRSRPRTALSWATAFILTLIAAGTTYYHADLTFLGQTFDFGGMNLLILLALFWYAARANPHRQGLAWLGYVLAVLASFAVLIWAPEVRRGIFAVLVLLTLWLYWQDPARLVGKRRDEERRWLLAGLITLAVGYLFWNLDTYRVLCDPTSWLQGHAFWHLASAAAAYYLYRAMRLLS